ncbi:hypothetical protein RRG08_060065 [Elysia crispata]|uniref:LIM zinc-binding domain-containing protein n=1 Tax=Elysia crispata TaxID=231223 RepID=A0AAE0Y180_9GAST|nr:hypothetical protein RRG08_060065 [Elysia crispata]
MKNERTGQSKDASPLEESPNGFTIFHPDQHPVRRLVVPQGNSSTSSSPPSPLSMMRPGSNGNPGVNNNGSGMMMNHHPHHHGFPGAYNPGGAPGSQPNPNNNNNNVSVGGNTMMMMNSGMGGGGGPPQHHVNSPSSTGNNSNSASYHMNGAGIPASGPVTVNNQHQPPGGSPKQCAGCGVRIQDRFLLLAMDRYWHTGCLKCSCCQAQLGEIGTSCFTKAGMILCRNDYIR